MGIFELHRFRRLDYKIILNHFYIYKTTPIKFMILKEFTRHQYIKFSKAKGSEYIASEYALFRILQFIKLFNPKLILEVGAGIGTISDSILKLKTPFNLELYATESNEFCLHNLQQNLENQYKHLNLYNSIGELPEEKLDFDLVIIDGKEKGLLSLINRLSKNAIIIVEGDRKDQTDILKSQFPSSKFVHSISSYKNNSYSNRSSNNFQGGLKIIFIDPTLKQMFFWIKLKALSKFNFQLRKLAK